MANSIIGVAILSMPYCFKQCGIILATVMILFSGIIVKVLLSRDKSSEIYIFKFSRSPVIFYLNLRSWREEEILKT